MIRDHINAIRQAINAALATYHMALYRAKKRRDLRNLPDPF